MTKELKERLARILLYERTKEIGACLEILDAILAELGAAGYAVVLRSDTEETKLAGARALRDSFGWDNQCERAVHCKQAMIAAAEGD